MWDLINIILLGLTIKKTFLGPIDISLIVLSWHDIVQGHKVFHQSNEDCLHL
jgi:hypothetical protein